MSDRLFQIIDFERVKRKPEGSYAGQYLYRCDKESKSDDEMDMQVFEHLSELDTKLGTPASEKLFSYLSYRARWDIIKVRSNDLNLSFKIISDYRF